MNGVNTASNRPFPPGMPVAPGEVIAKKYRVADLVAVGGMGIIVAAEHLQLGQRVAIKVLLPSEAEDAAQSVPRFLREARAAAALRSDHVVRIYDMGTLDSGLPFMVMELLAGQDLRRLVKTEGPLQPEQAVDYLLQAADAIGEAHAVGIVHRDLKPSNLFMTRRSDGKALIKVLDFGISKSADPLADGALTTTRAMIGSPLYMSPEQIRDAKSVDGRTDIWSLGVILHELLSGRSAFRGESLPAICAAIAADPPASLGEVRTDVPPELEAVVLRCLEKDPARRYQSVGELRAALGGHETVAIGNAPTLPAPPGSGRAVLRGLPLGQSGPRPVASTGRESWPSHVSVETVRAEGDASQPTVALAPSGGSTLESKAVGAVPARVPAARPRSWLWGLVLVLGLGLVGAVVLLARPRETAQPAPATSFALTIESTPSGATVLDGDRALGTTPFNTRIAREEVSGRPRVFRLRLPGHLDYRIEQGSSSSDVQIHADLADEPKPEPALESAKADDAAPSGKRRARAPEAPRPSTHPTPTGSSPKPSTDIRLSR
jgi:serine/threonine protein kinase